MQAGEFGSNNPAYRLLEVEQLINTSVIVGNRELKFTVPTQSIWLSPRDLELVSDSEAQHEFAADNPFGAYKYETRFTKDLLEIVCAVYEKATNITIIEKNDPKKKGLDKTLYSDSFFDKHAGRAFARISELVHGDLEPEDLIFELKEIKETNHNG